MNREELLTFLRTWLQKFRGTPWFRITYLVLLGIIVAQLYPFLGSALACLIILLIPVLVFVIPYWLGERKIRRFAGNGALVFTIAILVAAAMLTQAILAQPGPVPRRSSPEFHSAPGLNLTNGTVAPYRGSAGETFTFRVNLTTAGNGTPDAFSVFLNLTAVGFAFVPSFYPMAYSPGPTSSPNTRNGTWYERNLTLGDSIYLYGFSVTDRDQNWTETLGEVGPIIASGWSFFGLVLYDLAWVQGFFPTELVLYFGVIFLWWYMTRARERVMRAGRPAARPETTPTKPPERKEAAEGTRAAKATAFTCTNCGADVSESDKKCPSCGAAFED